MRKHGNHRRNIIKIMIGLFGVLILLGIGLGVFLYLNGSSGMEAVLSRFGLGGRGHIAEREVPETDMGEDYYHVTEKEHIVTDPDNGLMYADNELLVTLAGEESEGKLSRFAEEYEGAVVGKLGAVQQYQLQFQERKSYAELTEIRQELDRQDWVDHTGMNWAFQTDPSEYYPNDKKWKRQWGKLPEGDNWGMEAIDAPEAWEWREQMEPVNIGLIDSMFDVSHEDLVFQEEPLGNVKGTEDADFRNNGQNHGTHVAGTMAAVFDNETGVTGVFPESRLYGASLWGISAYGYGTVMGYETALSYLIVQKECKVVNISMGSDWLAFEASRDTEACQELIEEQAQELGRFLSALLEADYDFVICKSAGNQNAGGEDYLYFPKEAEDTEHPWQYYRYKDYLTYMKGDPDGELTEELKQELSRYRGKIDEKDCEGGNVDAVYNAFTAIDEEAVKRRIIVVGAAENLGTHREGGFLFFGGTKVHDGYEVADFSQCGERVDLLAPGVNICSTVRRGNGYEGGWDGTSMASPHAAGTAAMIFSVRPDMEGDKVRDLLRRTARGSYGEEGYGLLNAGKAMEEALEEEEETTIQIAGADTSEERDIVLVLDVSGSMSGEPIEETKKAAEKFVQTILGEDASIGIVTYNSEASVASEFSTRESSLCQVIDGLDSSGGTNIEAGLIQAEEMLEESQAKKRIMVLMSDGEPTDGKEGEELIACADELKEKGTYIYTLGFFSALSDKSSAQYLMEEIASEGCHYEVDDADNLVYFFGDIADQINGQKYIYVRIACPVDVSVTDGNETLSSRGEEQSTRTDFGTMTFEEEAEESDEYGEEVDNRIKILRLKEGTDYEISIVGTAAGSMDYTISLMDEEGEYSDIRRFEGIEIGRGTVVDTTAARAGDTLLNVDTDGDGAYDLRYRAGANETGALVEYFVIIYVILGVGYLTCFLLGIVVFRKAKKAGRHGRTRGNRGR